MNFLGQNDGQGTALYHDGVMVGRSSTLSDTYRKSLSSRRIVIGKYAAVHDHFYASLQMDELKFFNHSLTDAEITSLSQLFT